MATQPPTYDYTNRDYQSLLQSMLDLAVQKLPEWTDRSENDVGRMLLESFAYVGDVLLYYQDRIANEAFLSTAVERRSVIDLLSLIGYTLATPAPASTTIAVTRPTDVEVVIDVGAKFATRGEPGKPAVEFLYLPTTANLFDLSNYDINPPIVIPAGGERFFSVINATLVNSESAISTGEPNQHFPLTQSPVLLTSDPNAQDYFQVRVNAATDGDAETTSQSWEKRATLLYSGPEDPHFMVRVDADDRAELIFGDGRCGKIPSSGSRIQYAYLKGGGPEGNIGPNTLTVSSGVTPPDVTITHQAATGGAARESIDHARQQAPKVFRSFQRAVTAADYEALAENFPGVARAKAIGRSLSWIEVFIMPTAGLIRDVDGKRLLSSALQARLMRYFADHSMLMTSVSVRSPQMVNINITADVGIEPSHYAEEVEQRAQAALKALFAIDQLSFGQTIYLSKVYEALEAINGVAYVDVTNFQKGEGKEIEPKIPLQDEEFPQLGDYHIVRKGVFS
jgi:uncharacterized phage protein gp47/JayE